MMPSVAQDLFPSRLPLIAGHLDLGSSRIAWAIGSELKFLEAA